MFKSMTFRTTLIAIACAASFPAYAVANDVPRRIDVPAGELITALQQLAQQSGAEFIYSVDQLKGVRTRGMHGEYTPEIAVTKLLEGTTLTVTMHESGALLIAAPLAAQGEPQKPAQAAPADADGDAKAEDEAEAESAAPATGVERDETTTIETPTPESSHRDSRNALGEIVVTGSRLKGATADSGAAPVTVFDRQKIERLGVTTLPEFFRYVSQQPFVRSEESMAGAGGQYVDLRGIGTGSTAVLINGRPAAASPSSGTFNAVDINSIPLAAIERIEILTSSASAVYGANAMGGAMNIVLKRDLGAPQFALRYGTAEGGGEEHRASMSAGHSGARFHGSLFLDYFDRGALLGEERDRWANQDYRRFGSVDRRSPSSNPTTVSSLSPANLPGLGSRFAAVPAGSSGVGLTPEDFAATQGQRNLDSLGRFRSIVGDQERVSATAFGEFQLTSALQVFGELMHEESDTAIRQSPSALPLVVPAANLYNPFDVPVSVTYLFTGVGPRKRHSEAESDRLLLGLRGEIRSWDWEISGLRTKGDGRQETSENTVDFARVNAALAATDPDEALNVFQDGPGGTPELLASLVAPVSAGQAYEGDTRLADLQFRGPLWQLPAGALEAVLGGSRTKEEILFANTAFLVTVTGDRMSSAAFAEVGIPLVDAAMRVPAVSALRVTLAGRYDDYSDFGSTTNPQYGLVWSPLRDLSLRFSHGTSFSPPSLFTLYAPRQQFPSSVTDPRRNNETVPIALLVGGNPELEPTDGKSTTAGFVLTPARLPGLRLTATYWELEVDNRVTVIFDQQLVNNESAFPSRVVRAEPTPTDVALGLPGRITTVDITRINFGRLETSGIDWDVSYSLDTQWGNFTPSLNGTYTADYSAIDLPNTPPVERVGIASINGTIPKWKMSTTLAWSREWIAASATARYLHSYDDAIFGIGPTGRRVPSQTLVDAQLSVDLGARYWRWNWFEDMRLTAGVANLFDREPPFMELFGDAGYDMTQGDLVGRSGYLNLTLAF